MADSYGSECRFDDIAFRMSGLPQHDIPTLSVGGAVAMAAIPRFFCLTSGTQRVPPSNRAKISSEAFGGWGLDRQVNCSRGTLTRGAPPNAPVGLAAGEVGHDIGELMKIGELVKTHLGRILAYCETEAHGELTSLLSPAYSKRVFGLGFPFCRDAADIDAALSKRYWTETWLVRGKRIRVTSQWFEGSRAPFLAYLESIGITPAGDSSQQAPTPAAASPSLRPSSSKRANSRYRGNHIGNAQNLFVRNILSNLGVESFSEADWTRTKAHFGQRCAYCGCEGDLVLEHAIPINKEALGEHRLGNLVPACPSCNAKKANQDFRTFLEGNPEAIARIEAYMDSRNYVPLEENAQIALILKLAHREIGALAERYITIINELFAQGSHLKTNPAPSPMPTPGEVPQI